MNRLDAIEMFQTVAERQSLTEAAKRLGKSLPTVVRQLADLERHLGVRLFRRTTRRVEITEDGLTYLRFCQRVRAELESIEDELRGKLAEPTGQVTISAPLLFGQIHVAPAVTQILARYPGLNIRLSLQDRIVDLLEDHIDIALRIGHLKDSSLIARGIGEVRQVLCASPALLKKRGAPKTPADLSNLPCIRLDGNNFATSWPFLVSGKKRLVPVTGQLTTNIMRPAIDACVAGLGFGLFLSYQVRDEVQRGRLKLLLRKYEPQPLPVHLVHAGSRLLSSRVRTVLDELAVRLKPAVSR